MRSLGLALAMLALGASPSGAQTEPLPPGSIAKVGERVIAKSDFDHWYAIAVRSGGDDPTIDADEEASYRAQVVQLLISYEWIDGEAADRGVRVSNTTVRRRFRRQKRASFRTEAQYERFLEESGQTEADILWRVRMHLLSDRLRVHATRRAKTPRGQQRLLDRFVRRFNRKWKLRTVCGEEYYLVRECGSTAPIAAPPPG